MKQKCKFGIAIARLEAQVIRKRMLEGIDLRFGFPGRALLKGVSFSLERGKIYALMGSNGAGKTTLFNLITGFLKLQAGSIRFENKEIAQLSPSKINQLGICRTFQSLRLSYNLTVKENVLLAMKGNPTDKWVNALLPKSVFRARLSELGKRADEVISRFFLAEVAISNASEISYGQQKLLNLACSVANGASMLLLDEAVVGVQPEYRKKIAILLQQMKAQGKTILLIEHNTEFIAELADGMFFLHDGLLSNFEKMEDLRKDLSVMGAYF